MAWSDPRTWVAGETLTAALLNAQLRDQLDAAVATGKLDFFVRAATTVETPLSGGWLECNGVSVLRATYPDLNTLLSGLSYPFGSVDGTHFTLPDLQGRSLVAMASGGHADVNALGDSDGLTKTSRTPEGSVAVSVSGSITVDSGVTGGESISGTVVQSGTGVVVASTPHVHGDGSLAGSFSGSGSGPVPGNYLVAGCWFIKY